VGEIIIFAGQIPFLSWLTPHSDVVFVADSRRQVLLWPGVASSRRQPGGVLLDQDAKGGMFQGSGDQVSHEKYLC